MVACRAHLRFVVASLSLLLVTADVSRAQQPLPKFFERCNDSSRLFRKSNGRVVWFSPKQMNAISIDRVTPPFPGACRCQGQVFVAVIVNREGKVACAHVISGHPLLASPSIQAATKWTFKPMTKRGRNVSFVGLLAFTFNSNGAVTY